MENITQHTSNTPTSLFKSTKDFLNVIARMALQFKIRIFPCKADKSTILRDFNHRASCDAQTLSEWKVIKSLALWGMPTSRFFALNLKGDNPGKIKKEWLNKNPYSQKIPGGGRYWLFKNPGSRIGNKPYFTGDFEIQGNGGYVCLYSLIFTALNPPEKVPEAPQELLSMINYSKVKPWQRKKKNNILFQKIKQDLEKNRGRGIPDILETAQASGLPKSLTENTAKFAIQSSLNEDHDFIPDPPAFTPTPYKEASRPPADVTTPKPEAPKKNQGISEKRQRIRNEILDCIKKATQETQGTWTKKEAIVSALKPLNLKTWECSNELGFMVNDKVLERKFEDRKAVYRAIF